MKYYPKGKLLLQLLQLCNMKYVGVRYGMGFTKRGYYGTLNPPLHYCKPEVYLGRSFAGIVRELRKHIDMLESDGIERVKNILKKGGVEYEILN